MVDAASTTRTRRRPRTWTTVRPPSPTGRIRPLRVHRLQCDLVPRPASPPAPGALGYPPASPGKVDEQIPLPQRLVAAGRHSRAFFRYRYAPTVLAGASHLAQICHGVVPAAHQSQRLPRLRHRHVLQPASFLAIPLVCPRAPLAVPGPAEHEQMSESPPLRGVHPELPTPLRSCFTPDASPPTVTRM